MTTDLIVSEAQVEKITRFEVIDHTGRPYSLWNCTIELSLQDNGRTLKVFVTPKDRKV